MKLSDNKSTEQDQLLLKCIQNIATDAELRTAWEWINSSAENRVYYEKMRDAWMATALNTPVNQRQEDLSLKRIKRRIKDQHNLFSKPRGYQFIVRLTRYAAIFILIFLSGIIVSQLFIPKKVEIGSNTYYTVEAPRGAKTFLTLTDGTKVWLNAGSRLKYKHTYNQGNRDVYLEGEGYFDVAQNRKAAFLVHASNIVVRAIGTEFNVKAYPDDKTIETTLVKGSISIVHSQKNGISQITYLKPNQNVKFLNPNYKATSDDNEDNSEVPAKIAPRTAPVALSDHINTQLYTSWKDKRLVFENENLVDFTRKLGRLYDVNFIYKDPELKKFNISGTIQEETVEQVLSALKLTVPMEYTIEHKDIIITVNKQLKDKYKSLLK